MAIDDTIVSLGTDTKRQVEETLKSIDIALKLNSSKMKGKKIPKDLKKLVEWREALIGWHKQYGKTTEVVEIAEGLGAFQEICVRLA